MLQSKIVSALERTGRRGLILSGWGRISDENEHRNILTLDSVEHSWILPRTAAMVHHGGAGTVGECLRAGIPSIAWPLGYDGMFWGVRISNLGAALPPLRGDSITVTKMCECIEALTGDSQIRKRSQELKHILARERGLATAADILVGSKAVYPSVGQDAHEVRPSRSTTRVSLTNAELFTPR